MLLIKVVHVYKKNEIICMYQGPMYMFTIKVKK